MSASVMSVVGSGLLQLLNKCWCFLGGSSVKNLPAGDAGSIPGSEKSLTEGMATHSSILAWKIPWTEEPGGLQSMGSQRLGPDGSD